MEHAEARAMMEEFQKKWRKQFFLKGKEAQKLAEEIDFFTRKTGADYPSEPKLRQGFETSGEQFPSAYMKRNYRKLVELFVEKPYLEDYYHIIDKMPQFCYSRGVNRRSVRSREYGPWFGSMLELLNSYKLLSFYGVPLVDFLSDRLPEKKLAIKNSYWYGFRMSKLDLILAARIDAGDEKIISLIREMILGDNNTAVVSVEVIRGIVMSGNRELHKLLADFLLAARLQEGVRQAVCENADCGMAEAFLQIFNTICDNNLIRFAAVKRAVATWTGLCDLEHVERITDKVLQSVRAALNDFPGKALEYTKTNDSILIMCGLWALGFHDVKDAVAVMDGYVTSGTRNQILTMGYYNYMLQYKKYAMETASKIVKKYPGDYEIISVFMSSFLHKASDYAYQAVDRRYGSGRENGRSYKRIPVEYLFADRDEAYAFYDIMKNIYRNIPKKRLEFDPVIFPWYSSYLSKTQLVIRMCVTAYALEDDDLKDDACGYLSAIDTGEYYANRSVYLELLTHDHPTPVQRKTLLEAVADKETFTRETAFRMIKELVLSKEEYILLEGLLKYKTAAIRKQVLELLNQQPGLERIASAKRLLASDKAENRMGGLSILQDMKQTEKALEDAVVKAAFDEVVESLADFPKITDSEQVIIQELRGKGKASEVLNEEGYGLYDPGEVFVMPQRQENPAVFEQYFAVSGQKLEEAFAKLDDFYDVHGMMEYKTAYGEEMLLANGFSPITYNQELPIWERYPFKELWVEFYETYIKDPALLTLMRLSLSPLGSENLERKNVYDCHMEELLGGVLCRYCPKFKKRETARSNYAFENRFLTIVEILCGLYPDEKFPAVCVEVLNRIIYGIGDEDLWYKIIRDENKPSYYSAQKTETSLISSGRMQKICNGPGWKTDEEFAAWFAVFHDVDRRFVNNSHNKEEDRYYGRPQNRNKLGILDYVKAHVLGLIPENEVYKAAFEYYSLGYTLDTLSLFLLDKPTPYQKNMLAGYMEGGEIDRECAFYKKATEIYGRIMDKVLDVELSRGDLPTVFSKGILKANRFYGMERMVQILVALGKEKLDRSTYYYYGGNGESRKVVLSHLLQACYPNPGDSAERFAELLKEKKISRERLYETMMYAPQWIDIIQEYLGLELKTGCYYFMAHMNERFDDRKKAVIAKYTPLSEEELNNGAFDLDWFKSAYRTLGDEVFDRLYDAAKYISDGSKHSRARKYANAALGRVTGEGLEAEIADKRNKDLLMSYGILPLSGEKDVLRRYEFIQKFRRESRQFGAQRKASEGIACDMAMKNLATNAGYRDVTRLTLAMETRMVESEREVFEDRDINGTTVRLAVDGEGKAEILCAKNGKTLKSLPAALKKDEHVLHLKEMQKKLKEQYSRTVKMFEQAMEEREIYEWKELRGLTANPIIAPIVNSLVYVTADSAVGGDDSAADGNGAAAGVRAAGGMGGASYDSISGLLSEKGLIDWDGCETALEENAKLRVAHPYDLYRAGNWVDYQNLLFEKIQQNTMGRQPFKQVFRELYVKLPEEADVMLYHNT